MSKKSNKLSQVSLVLAVVGIGISVAAYASIKRTDTLVDITKTLSDSVVMLTIPERGGGTGFAITTGSGKRVIMSNWHVCHPAGQGSMTVTFKGSVIGTARILKEDPMHDLCILTGPKLKPLRLGQEPDLHQQVYTGGHRFCGHSAPRPDSSPRLSARLSGFVPRPTAPASQALPTKSTRLCLDPSRSAYSRLS